MSGYAALAYVQIQASIAQIYQQRRVEQLAQVLYEADRTAGALEYLARSDPFSAGVIACLRLRVFSSLDASLFPTFEQKKSWDAAIARLRGLWAPLEQDRNALDYLSAWDEVGRWNDALGDRQQVERNLSVAHRSARYARMWPKGMVWAGGAVFVLSVVSLAVGYLSAFVVIGPLLSIIGAVWLLVSAESVKTAEDRERAYATECRRFDAFMAAPSGGGRLARFAAQHPALVSFDPLNAPVNGSTTGPDRLIERQVVVARCRYCGQMTPVDLGGCQFCGGKL
jgi:hypothetical protein